MLLDTGFNTALSGTRPVQALLPERRVQAGAPGPGEPIEEALAAVGVDIDEIHAVGMSATCTTTTPAG